VKHPTWTTRFLHLIAMPPVAAAALGLAACGGSSSGTKAADGAAAEAPTPAALALTPTGAPHRRDGYWEMASFSDRGTQMGKQFICVGGDSENRFSVFDQLAAVGDCNKRDFKRTATGWTFETRCQLMDKETVQKGTISGDFQQSFRVDQTVTQGADTAITGSIRGQRIGDCPAKFKPGDLVDQGGDLLGNMLPH
jgi:hypothetical protein